MDVIVAVMRRGWTVDEVVVLVSIDVAIVAVVVVTVVSMTTIGDGVMVDT